MKILIAFLFSLFFSGTSGSPAVRANINSLTRGQEIYVYYDHDYVEAEYLTHKRRSVTVKFKGDGHTRTVDKSKIYSSKPVKAQK